MQECPMKAKCRERFRRGEAACQSCTLDIPWGCETSGAEANSVPDWYDGELDGGESGACEESSDGVVEDEYGNEGSKLFDVTVVFERSQVCKKTYRIAADDEDDAKERVCEETGDEDYEDLEWEDQGDGTTDYVDEVVEV